MADLPRKKIVLGFKGSLGNFLHFLVVDNGIKHKHVACGGWEDIKDGIGPWDFDKLLSLQMTWSCSWILMFSNLTSSAALSFRAPVSTLLKISSIVVPHETLHNEKNSIRLCSIYK
jgi:hypothetical protein